MEEELDGMDNPKHNNLEGLEWISSSGHQPNHFSLGHPAKERRGFPGRGELASIPKSPQIIYITVSPPADGAGRWGSLGGVTNPIANWLILGSYSAQMPNYKYVLRLHFIPWSLDH